MTGWSAFRCYQCDRRFKESRSLKRHEITHVRDREERSGDSDTPREISN